MSDTAYHALRDFLDRYPLGFPKTESGVEIEILKRLFTEEEARLAVRLSPFLEEIGQIAERLSVEVDTLAGAKGAVKVLNALGIEPVLLPDERCCGHDLLWGGDVEHFEKLARKNVELLKAKGVKTVLFNCPE